MITILYANMITILYVNKQTKMPWKLTSLQIVHTKWHGCLCYAGYVISWKLPLKTQNLTASGVSLSSKTEFHFSGLTFGFLWVSVQKEDGKPDWGSPLVTHLKVHPLWRPISCVRKNRSSPEFRSSIEAPQKFVLQPKVCFPIQSSFYYQPQVLAVP